MIVIRKYWIVGWRAALCCSRIDSIDRGTGRIHADSGPIQDPSLDHSIRSDMLDVHGGSLFI